MSLKISNQALNVSEESVTGFYNVKQLPIGCENWPIIAVDI